MENHKKRSNDNLARERPRVPGVGGVHMAGLWPRAVSELPSQGPQKPKLFDRVREAIRTGHYSRRTKTAMCEHSPSPVVSQADS